MINTDAQIQSVILMFSLMFIGVAIFFNQLGAGFLYGIVLGFVMFLIGLLWFWHSYVPTIRRWLRGIAI